MRSGPTLVERAFQLAKSGQFQSCELITRRLSREGYVNAAGHLNSGLLRRQLNNEIKLATAPVSIEARLEAEARLAAGEVKVEITRMVSTMIRLRVPTGLKPI